MAMSESKEAAAFGNSFGFINALISGLALISVVYALMLQTQELEASAKSNREQLEIAGKTARVQTLTYLAQWHHRLMRETKGASQEINRRKCEFYAECAVQLMKELGQSFRGLPNADDIEVSTDAEIGVQALQKILKELESGLQDHWDRSDTREATDLFQHARTQVKNFVEEFQGKVDVRVLDTTVKLLGTPSMQYSEDPSKDLVGEYWQQGRAAIVELNSAINALQTGADNISQE